jgi:hypothetical protein
MEPIDFPPNSEASKNLTNAPRVQRVTTGEAKTKKKSLRKQFAETFVGGDMKTAIRYTLFDILLPEARDLVWSVFSGGFEKFIYGDGRHRRGYSGYSQSQSGSSNYQQQYQYNRMYSGGPLLGGPARALSRAARQKHNFDEIIVDSRSEAEEVITQMFEVMNHYDAVTVADLYDLVGLSPTHTDYKWGWTNLRGAGASRVRDGYLLDLPDPEPID